MILPFEKISKNDAPKAGGKGASLGEMTQAGIPVPPGFVVLSEAFETFLDTNSLRSEINQILGNIDHNSVTSIEGASEKIQELIKNGQIPSEIQKEIQKYQETLNAPFVAVRSSATAEDGAEHAWAGQLDTYLNVAKGDVEKKIQSCWASLFTPRALFYRSEKGLGELHISVAVVVQSMVDAESAGVAFSVHPVTENHDEIVVEGSWGLGEAVVSGEVTPDSFVISKSSGEILSEHIADKKKGIFRNKDGQNEWLEIDTEKREKPILTKEKIQKLSELIIQIENHYGFPCDIEWAHSKEKIYILQARPITTLQGKKNFTEKKGGFNSIKQEKWIKNVTREVTVFPAASVTKSFGQISDIFEVPFDYEHILFVGNTWYYKQSDYERLKKIFLQKIEDNQNYVTHIAKKQKEAGERLKKFVQKLPKKIITEEVSKILKEYEKKMTEFYAFWWIAIPVGEILEVQVKKILKEKGGIDFNELMFVRQELELVREKRLRNKIGIECAQYKNYDDVPKKLKEKFIKHAKKFGWINTSYHIGKSITAQEFFQKIKQENPKKEIKSMKEERIKEKKILRFLNKNFSKSEQTLCESMQAIMYLRNYQKETVNECQYKSEEFLEKIAAGIGLKWDTFLSFSMEEILIYLEEKIPEKMYNKIAKQRVNGFVIEWKNKKISVYEKNIKKYEALVRQKISEENTQISGNVAYPGKITGTVRVIKKKSDINSFIPGEILVTNMTSIDYVHIMGRASAIITNEGGITCHAAIFSRELKIPCIIGTKNATELLKNGDFIELNGHNGIVKVIQGANKTVAT